MKSKNTLLCEGWKWGRTASDAYTKYTYTFAFGKRIMSKVSFVLFTDVHLHGTHQSVTYASKVLLMEMLIGIIIIGEFLQYIKYYSTHTTFDYFARH